MFVKRVTPKKSITSSSKSSCTSRCTPKINIVFLHVIVNENSPEIAWKIRSFGGILNIKQSFYNPILCCFQVLDCCTVRGDGDAIPILSWMYLEG